MPSRQAPPEPIVETNEIQEALTAPVVDDRPGVLEVLGMPDAFDISIIEVEGGKIRKESWRYYQYGTRVDFVDGEAVWTIAIEPMPEDTIFAAWYDPLSFGADMSSEQVTQVIVNSSPANAVPTFLDLSIGGEDLAGSSTLIGDQIMVGFFQDRLVYVETVALSSAGGQ
jgi:hypothetical protein